MILVFTGRYRGDERRRSKTVSKDICRTISFDYDTIVGFRSVYMNVMLIYQKCLRDDGESFVDLTGQFLVSFGELLPKLFIR